MSPNPRSPAARNIVLNLVNNSPTSDELRNAVDLAATMLESLGDVIDRHQLFRELEADLNVFQPDSASLNDDAGHLEWLGAQRDEISWPFWNRYLRYLQEREAFPPLVLQRLDATTARILGKLENPSRPGPWDRRGMVVGQVQSGKTGNYTGLICRAADAGYRLIVVLAGMHNSLRSQTQYRLDTGFLGADTQQRQLVVTDDGFAAAKLGVGRLVGEPRLDAASLTTSLEKGDFGVATARRLGIILGGYPVLLVVKKHAGILKNLREWLVAAEGVGEPKRIRDFPLLVIDDEADNASINTKDTSGDPDTEPTSVNRAIRQLLRIFDRKAYVGYTATPYANIYIDPDSDHSDYGDDLFPRSFIEYLRPPSNYFGPAQLFGLDPELDPLPLYRRVDDTEGWIPDRHKNHHVPGPLPESVRAAIRSFVLARAVRIAQGTTRAHNSMLIHVTRFTSVQAAVRSQVDEELELLKSRIKFGDGDGSNVREELRRLWDADLVPTSAAMGRTPMSWRDIDAVLLEAVDPIVVKTINGVAEDALEYVEHVETGLNVIAIGGNKLSRGLTLEGLSVSYYLRATGAFDTLLQMGRWFGYRPGYEDLCRLFTSDIIWHAYREVSVANEELITEFEEMALHSRTPTDFGLKVRNSVDGMLVTAANKMRAGANLRVGFAGTVSETVVFPCDGHTGERNLDTLQSFVRTLRSSDYAYSQPRQNHVWSEVSGDLVRREFFDRFRTADAAWRVNAATIASYIRNRLAHDELTDWTVVLLSAAGADDVRAIGGLEVGLTKRRRLGDRHRLLSRALYSIRRILSPSDEYLDFDPSEVGELLDTTTREYDENPGRRKKPPEIPSGTVVRRARPMQRGLLLLYPLSPIPSEDVAEAADGGVHLADGPLAGFAASFPSSPRAPAMDYVVNRQFLLDLLGEDDDEDDYEDERS